MDIIEFDRILESNYKKTVIKAADGKITLVPNDQVINVQKIVTVNDEAANAFCRFSFKGNRPDLMVMIDWSNMDAESRKYHSLIREGLTHIVNKVVGYYDTKNILD